ncbi:MAG TPA: SGNH/GDSL hydrolase family protein [Glaciihabitans sp.]|jgi:hypothetical protein|nr:SGNH/GDSL hydrolase family protein [Glaciihabitans sp.]
MDPMTVLRGLMHLAARPLITAHFVAQLHDVRNTAFPRDAGSGVILGTNPERVVVIGDFTAIGYGTVSHELGIAGHFARQLARRSGGGVEWSTEAFPDLTIRTAGAVVNNEARFARTDVVIMMIGIGDALKVTSAANWSRMLEDALAQLSAVLPIDARILIPDIPPIEVYPGIPRPIRAIVGPHAALLNRTTRTVAASHSQAVCVAFPREHIGDVSSPQNAHASAVYSSWARLMIDELC